MAIDPYRPDWRSPTDGTERGRGKEGGERGSAKYKKRNTPLRGTKSMFLLEGCEFQMVLVAGYETSPNLGLVNFNRETDADRPTALGKHIQN